MLNKEQFRRYLDHPSLLFDEIKSELNSNSGELVVMIDEVQLLPLLMDEVHRTIEAFKPRIIFILTGSSARKLKRENANLLAGRALRLDFFPLGLDEIEINDQMIQTLHWGTLPEVVTTKDNELKTAYLMSYVGTYLDEEIKKEAQIRNLQGFSRFLELASAQNGQCVNYSKIAKAAGVADVTIKEYFQILSDTFLAYHIPAWTYSLREQLQKAPKYYIFDNGVVNAILGELGSNPNPATYRFGRLFENFVIGQLMQYRSKHSLSSKLYHYRSKTGKEIDLIVQRNPHSPPVAIEIKSAESPGIGDVKQLVSFQEAYPKGVAVVICRTPQSYTSGDLEFLSITDGLRKVFELAGEEH